MATLKLFDQGRWRQFSQGPWRPSQSIIISNNMAIFQSQPRSSIMAYVPSGIWYTFKSRNSKTIHSRNFLTIQSRTGRLSSQGTGSLSGQGKKRLFGQGTCCHLAQYMQYYACNPWSSRPPFRKKMFHTIYWRTCCWLPREVAGPTAVQDYCNINTSSW
jgi:hypothetical protein